MQEAIALGGYGTALALPDLRMDRGRSTLEVEALHEIEKVVQNRLTFDVRRIESLSN